jgi:hypothetical protein
MTFNPNDDDRLWKESEPEGWFRFGTPLKYGIFIILLICLVVGLWYLLSPARRTYAPTDLALIKADETPYKVKAEDQGIPSVKHQDKLVYGRIRNDQNEPPAEHILPDPEGPSLKMVKQYIPSDEDGEKGPAQPPEKETSLTSISDLIEELPEEKSSPEKKKHKGTIFIQLGSLNSNDLAEAEWTRLSRKHKDILDGFDPLIQRVDLGTEKGIQYRLRTGAFENLEDAQKACAQFKERKVECLVIK